jgi:hypothetical protein
MGRKATKQTNKQDPPLAFFVFTLVVMKNFEVAGVRR